MASAAARQSIPIRESITAVNPGELLNLKEDLETLCAEGMIEVILEDGVMRYRPINI